MIQDPLAALLGGGIAALLVYPVNVAVQRRLDATKLLLLSPWWEELAKITASYLVGGGLFMVHLVFGIIEAVSDWGHGQLRNRRDAIVSVVLHALVGALGSWCGFAVSGNSLFTTKALFGSAAALSLAGAMTAWLVSVMAHLSWNYGVTRRMRNRCS